MVLRSIPNRLWDWGLVYEAEILSRTSRGDGDRTGLEALTGETPDISEWLDFGFYDLVWFYHSTHAGLGDKARRLGRWLGVSHRIGSDMCYYVLAVSGQVLSRTSVQHVTLDDYAKPELAEQIKSFNDGVNDRMADTDFQIDGQDYTTPYIQDIEAKAVDDKTRRFGLVPSDEEYGDMIEEEVMDVDEHADLEKYIGAQINLDIGGEIQRGTVVKRAKGQDGSKAGKYHPNPMFDSRKYVVEFEDKATYEYEANVIASNMFSQVDDEGNTYVLFKEFSDHRSDASALDKADGFTVSKNGNRTPKPTTRGWQILVEMKDGSNEWVDLRIAKESNPIELAEYAVANRIDEEPAFKWWVSRVLRQRNRIISKVKKKYWRTNRKFGIRLPHSVDEALKFDTDDGANLWQKAIDKEVEKVKIAWEAHGDLTKENCRAGKSLIGYTEIRCHMIFDIKMDFTRKARFVAGGHLTEAPTSITYSSVVSRDSVRLAFLIAGLNDLDITACDIGNAYLNAPCREKIWFLGGGEAGDDRGKVLVVTRALYGLRSSGASWRSMLAETIRGLGFVSTQADPDVWRRPATRKDGSTYYELLLVYVDDILAISCEPAHIIQAIDDCYKMKEGSVGPPDIYLGAQIYRHSLPDGSSAWGMSSAKYIRNAILTVESLLEEDGDSLHLTTKALTPFATNYKPELDFSPELNADLMSRFRQLIGILRWAIEIGRIDTYTETALLSQYSASPREGHLEAAYHIFAYLKSHPKVKIVFDPADVSLDASAFAPIPVAAWREFYGDLSEELPPGMPEPRGRAVDITCFVDADHAGNVITRRSHTGIIIFVQNAPIIWFSKKQNTVESSSFGSEFVALRAARDMIVSLRYKLRMFGVPIRGPASVLCDNQGVVKNTSLPESALSKRHNSINYHSVREAVAAGILRVGKENGETNLADAFTKVLQRMKRNALFCRMTYGSAFGSEGPPSKRQRLEDHDTDEIPTKIT
jgi:hypothetical protein